ncbi:hypothetical protein Pmani_010799 [Petrolisthes manimaculis]|uniref:Rho-GAP domain-containing protein n=1 Tax=Petrolisthes manimaculis TaxID=1843537 RepID=A0AAE1Q4A9_9EUCA|nr:hypothetical protein Pmani_010799 [Petrolisthes manimaculis]
MGGVSEGVDWDVMGTFVSGRGLKAAGRSEFRDLYCVLECDRVHKARTVFRHKLCYKGSVHLVSLLKESPLHQLALKIEPRGTLYLKLRYTPPRQAFLRTPGVRKNSLFGVDLDTVSNRILKDYLRELPEPIFTKCLYQMLVDALTVMLPDDPQGNAKLMFSILDCLPKVNRMTLFLLMDHLRLVASQSERNKMTTQNLAICFGPVLMLQSENEDPMDFHQPISILKFLLDLWPAKSAREAEAASARSVRPSHLDSGRRKSGPGSRMTTPRTTPRTTPTSQSPGSESDSSPNPPVNLRSKLVLTPMTTTTTAGLEAGGGTAPGSTSTTSTPTSSITSPPSTTAAPTSNLPPGTTEAASTLTATRGLDPDTETEEDKDGAETTSS